MESYISLAHNECEINKSPMKGRWVKDMILSLSVILEHEKI